MSADRGARGPMAVRSRSWLAGLAIVQLTVSFLLGGSGFRNDTALMVIELASLPLLGLGLWRIATTGAPRPWIFPLALLAGLACLPLLQLLPLPEALWNLLPGRAVALKSLTLAGIDQGFRPLSLTPDATWRAFLWLASPSALFLATLQLKRRARLALAITILMLLALSLLVAGLQMAGVDGLRFDRFSDPDSPSGIFANRNHQADAMVVGLPLSAAVIAAWGNVSSASRSLSRLLYVAVVGLLAVGALITLSRAGLVLGVIALAGSLFIFYRAQSTRPADRRAAAWILSAIAVLLLVVAQFGLGAVTSRFDRPREVEGRLQSWPTIVATAQTYFPAGAGLGAFDPVYRSVEPPETVGDTFVNAAHSEILQIWLEGGVLGVALLFAFLMWFGRAAIREWRMPLATADMLAQGAVVSVGIMLLHSLADYPLRTPALAGVFAVLCGFLGGEKKAPDSRRH